MWACKSIIGHMKAVWIAVMLGSEGGAIALLIQGVDRYKTCLFWGIFFWILSIAVAGLGFYSFKQASKIGRLEDMP